MDESSGFARLSELIDERSAAFRAAVASAPSLDVTVPTCPEWTLLDLVRHIGEGRRRWAATVAAGPAAAPAARSTWQQDPPREREALLEWLAAGTRQLLDALREAGPDRGCWTWWGDSQSPMTTGAVARHQLQEIAVHTYDAQLTAGAPEPLPEVVACDGVDEFLVTCCATTSPWPHEPAVVDYHATEGRSWRLLLSADGALVTDVGTDAADASARGPASDVVLFLYGRIPADSLELDGDRRLFDWLAAWEPA
ncbi:maleylpyruvate isomerase family mycothiol-dependent enzyme [Saccharothrix texasensis]|uniref:Uncharacterized protein (TIGR03083 family) n=1 Tax=Saccharothrix texasensis TaxID=103734 RepID=A0A3N1H0G7_9PSEU|nr:maleylpyruvate isomerase family mycothiol-dependent enzyme [Saccharothrix texasensis]ROP35886.1 uncharacterized protein (TIGR03083 family) [Saccharothrix texasensis]